jgi:hypothetical protein
MDNGAAKWNGSELDGIRWPVPADDVHASGGRERVLDCLEECLCAIWMRARVCLGGATLKTLFDRVLNQATPRWPHLNFAEVTCSGIRFDRTCAALEQASDLALVESFTHVLRELVTLLGNLSGQVLAQPLRAAVEAANVSGIRSSP